VELAIDATYLITKLGSVSFSMPSSNVLELNGVLYVPILTKNIFLILSMTHLNCVVDFYAKQVIIIDCN
jgi:hypothetical protein